MVTISKVLDSLENFLQDFGAMDFESMDLGEDAFFEEEIDWDDLSTILAVPPSRGEEHLQRIKGETQGLAETNATNSKTRNIPTTNHQTQKVTVSTTKVQTQKTTLPTTKDQTQNLPTTRDQSPTASAQTPKKLRLYLSANCVSTYKTPS
uniref:Uncharacterized protein n=1 Tax=Mucochytrium quahogii TaxID=96639 RepID=A0A7S2S9C1_9STRA|mmetsp:Transcript_26751/g.57878  ORF Transcript_26751/g.57878 Transcript_26751/m.57878 type:complete len:150 (+) Transcript_26751:571-1020(+)